MRSTSLLGAPAAFGFYLIAALALFGAPLFHDGECLCIGTTTDVGIFTWALEWWPHAIVHGENPFFTHTIYAPYGFDLAHGQLVPAAALLLWPVTAIGGPLPAFNLAMLLSPVLAALFAFLLCRRLADGRFWPALLGGWLFGFSTYLLAQLTSHLNLALVFLVPAMVHLVVRLAAGELTRRRFAVLMAAALVLQLGFSPEVLVSFSVVGALTLGSAWLLGDPTQQHRIAQALPPLAVAYAAAGVVALPYLYYALKPGGLSVLAWRSDKFSNDVLAFVVPGEISALGGRSFPGTTSSFTAGFVEGGAYLGLPLLALGGLGAWWLRRSFVVRVAAAGAAVAALLSLGGQLHVHGPTALPLPWALVNRLPITGLMEPARFAVYTALAVAVIATVALARRGGAVPWLLALLAVAAVAPGLGRDLWRSRPPVPAFFTSSARARELRPRDTVLVLPVGIAGLGMLWQAKADLGFRMAGGYVVPPEAPDPYQRFRIYPSLNYGGPPVPDQDGATREFIRATGVTAVIFDPHWGGRATWTPTLERLGWQGDLVRGVLLFRPARAQADAEATAQSRAAAIAQFRAFAAGDAARFCALQVAPERCRRTGAALLRSGELRAAARRARVGAATVTGLRATVMVRLPGRPVQRLPVRRVHHRWLVAGPLGP